MNQLYLLKESADSPWREVSKAEWVGAERSAGFHNTMGFPDEPGTASFIGREISGHTIINPDSFDPGVYDWDPDYQDAAAEAVARYKATRV